MADVFSRATDRRAEVTGDYHIPCPWCGHNCFDDIVERDNVGKVDAATETCSACGKEFMCPDEHGELVCVGLLSPADMKYLASREEVRHG